MNRSNRDRKPSSIKVFVLDLSGLEKKALEYVQKNKPDAGLVAMSSSDTWGYVKTPKGIYAICTEGVGDEHVVSEKNPFVVLFSKEFNRDGQKSFEVIPSLRNKLDEKDIMELPVKELVTLDVFIRSFGSRLECNYEKWESHLSRELQAVEVEA